MSLTSKIATEIASILQTRHETLAIAESCTGGALSATFTAIPGASEWFRGSIIAYAYESKESWLNISRGILDRGLVTPETAKAMAKGIAQKSKATYTLATTGVCGPNSSEGYTPCHVYIALYQDGLPIQVELFSQPDQGRSSNIQATVQQALTILLQVLYETV